MSNKSGTLQRNEKTIFAIHENHSKDMKEKITVVFILCVLCACTGNRKGQPFVRSVSLTVPEPVETTTIKSYPGVVREAHEISLGFKTPGQIERIHVEEGDFVREGTLLAELDDADYRLAVEAVQIQYDQLKDEVGRTRQLFEQKSISANDYEKASAGLKQLGVQLQVNKNKLDYTKLYAPADGYVQGVNFAPAEMVDAGTPVFTLLDVSRMEVEADIPVGEYLRRDRFTRFLCRTTDGTDFPMTLLSLTPKADGNQLCQLRLAFAGRPGEQWTAGMNVEVEIGVADTAAVSGFAVPLGAVCRDGDTVCVWVFGADSTVAKRPVVLGGTDGKGRALVREGLTGAERIVRAGVNALQEGAKVRVVEAPDKTNVGGLL